MPEKPKAPKKKPAKAAAPHARNSKPAAKSVYYVVSAECTVLVSDQKPKDALAAKSFAGFDEAKSAAIDSLIAAIEKAEGYLLALKRAKRLGDLPKARG